MIGYTTVGTDNIDKLAAFYDELFTALNAKRVMSESEYIAWANNPDGPMFSIHLPYDQRPASVGNGVMIGLKAASIEQVGKVYDIAMRLGGKDEGGPGERMPGFYAAYFRDLDGNKLNIHYLSAGS